MTTTLQNKDVAQPHDVEVTRGECYVTPKVDIYDAKDGLVLLAELPGVTQDNLDVELEDGILRITGRRVGLVEEPTYTEFAQSNFYRAFKLSEEIDSEKIKANLKDGLLTLSLPRAAHLAPRKIEITGS